MIDNSNRVYYFPFLHDPKNTKLSENGQIFVSGKNALDFCADLLSQKDHNHNYLVNILQYRNV